MWGLYGGRYGGRAWAQALPDGCVSSDTNPNEAVAGDTVTCSRIVNQTIATTVDDITINIGDVATVATVNTGSGDGVNVVTGNGPLTISMDNAGSSITGHANGIYARNDGTALTVTAAAVDGNIGIWAMNFGSDTTSITVTDVRGKTGDAIRVEDSPASVRAAATITVNGRLSGGSGFPSIRKAKSMTRSTCCRARSSTAQWISATPTRMTSTR